MEYLLHISYDLSFKKWVAQNGNEKKHKQEKKEYLQSQLKRRMGLYIDCIKQRSGLSNDGNTCRQFFSNSELSTEITNVSYQILTKYTYSVMNKSSSVYRV